MIEQCSPPLCISDAIQYHIAASDDLADAHVTVYALCVFARSDIDCDLSAICLLRFFNAAKSWQRLLIVT
jgi:hypothetical protein